MPIIPAVDTSGEDRNKYPGYLRRRSGIDDSVDDEETKLSLKVIKFVCTLPSNVHSNMKVKGKNIISNNETLSLEGSLNEVVLVTMYMNRR